jgi:Xaa-Pro aminopeptidase
MTKSKKLRKSPFVARRQRVVRKAGEAKVDALLVSRPEDVGYLSGFSGEDSCLLLGRGWAVLLTDGRFKEQAQAECPDVGLYVRKKGMVDAVREALKGRGVRRLGIQGGYVTVQFRDALAKKLKGVRIRAVGEVVSELRILKDDGEVRIIVQAARIAEKAFQELLALGKKWWVGRTERQLAAELEYRMRLLGADGPSFDSIIAVGPHGSLPHYRPGDTRVVDGQPVLIDWGAKVKGYCSDLTRVVLVGRIPPKLGEIYEVVRRSQAAGIAAARAGAALKSVDAAARKVIVDAGFGEQFVHSLGHGLGRQVHEAPGLAKLAKGRLRAGMVVTAEPGIYLPGVGGVRIEDDLLITATGCRRLTSLPRDIEAMRL